MFKNTFNSKKQKLTKIETWTEEIYDLKHQNVPDFEQIIRWFLLQLGMILLVYKKWS